MPTNFAGYDWLKSSLKHAKPDVVISPLGEKVSNLLGDLYQGIYHIDSEVMRVNWNNPHWISVIVRDDSYATFDIGRLTLFVVLCHDYCLRGSISVANFRKFELSFWQRQREGDLYTRHPTLEEHTAILREYCKRS